MLLRYCVACFCAPLVAVAVEQLVEHLLECRGVQQLGARAAMRSALRWASGSMPRASSLRASLARSRASARRHASSNCRAPCSAGACRSGIEQPALGDAACLVRR